MIIKRDLHKEEERTMEVIGGVEERVRRAISLLEVI